MPKQKQGVKTAAAGVYRRSADAELAVQQLRKMVGAGAWNDALKATKLGQRVIDRLALKVAKENYPAQDALKVLRGQKSIK